MSAGTEWPALPFPEWVDTYDTLHLVLQIIGKVRVALSPKEPEWAHIPLFVSARGLTTGPVPSNVGLLDVEADLLHHEVVIRTADGEVEKVPLRARPIAEFWADFTAALAKLGVAVELSPEAQEVPDPIPFPDDTVHASYEPEAATRFWRALTVIEPVFARYRAAFQGKVSSVQFFWGSADLNVTRFAGEPEYEQVSVGWWPGSPSFPKPAFYAYGSPRPEGIEADDLGVDGARWDTDLGEFVLDYDVVRESADPEATLRAFLDAAYQAVATRAAWDPRLTT